MQKELLFQRCTYAIIINFVRLCPILHFYLTLIFDAGDRGAIVASSKLIDRSTAPVYDC